VPDFIDGYLPMCSLSRNLENGANSGQVLDDGTSFSYLLFGVAPDDQKVIEVWRTIHSLSRQPTKVTLLSEISATTGE
jgi:hypothetical protein